MLLPLIATFFSSIVSLLAAGFVVMRGNLRHRFSMELSSLAAGVLLTTATLHLIPEALEEGLSVEMLGAGILGAIMVFFVLERLVIWVHHHHEVEGPHPSAWLVTLGDALHNLMDGFAIASAFQIDVKLGIFTALAIAAHELPHEIADFIVLLQSGLKQSRALALNLLSAGTAFVGVIVGTYFGETFEGFLPLTLAASGGMFLYIALSDIIPELHSHEHGKPWTQILFFFAGVGVVYLLNQLLHV